MSGETVGIIGLGAMGRGVASNLLRAGHMVVGYDINANALSDLAARGGKVAVSTKNLAETVENILLCVVNDAQVESVLFNDNGLLSADRKNTIVTLSTLGAPYVRDLGGRLREKGFPYLDCPMSGGEIGARNGTLTLMAGGDNEVFERVQPVLQAFGKNIFHVGRNPGDGATVKTINQLLCGVHLVASAEAVALAQKAGVDPALVYDVIKTSAAYSWMFGDRVPRMLKDDTPCSSAVDIFVKDMGLVLDLARSVGLSADLSQATYDKLKKASDDGLGKRDDSKVIAAYI